MVAIARLRVAAAPLRALALHSNRSFGSAAAAQCYYDDYEEEECAPRGMLDSQGCTPESGVQWVMIGEPGARRSLFAQRLSKLLEVPHISMATLLSQDLNPRSSLYHQVIRSFTLPFQGFLSPFSATLLSFPRNSSNSFFRRVSLVLN